MKAISHDQSIYNKGVQLVLGTTAFLNWRQPGAVDYGTTVSLLNRRRELVLTLPCSDPSAFRKHNPLLEMINDRLKAAEVAPVVMRTRLYGFQFEAVQKKGSRTVTELESTIDQVMEVIDDLCTIRERHEPVYSRVRTF